MWSMSNDIELAGASVEAALSVLVRETGIFSPIKQYMDYLTKKLYYRQRANLAREATLAAEKIKALGLSVASLDDPTVLRILEDGAWTDDEEMQVVWANLLVNAVTEGTPDVHASFRIVLGELEPVEAKTLDRLADDFADFAGSPEDRRFTPVQLESEGASGTHLDNLVRVGLLRYTRVMPTTTGSVTDAGSSVSGATFTDFGWSFVQACREPRPSD
jgi:hypothetical protein